MKILFIGGTGVISTSCTNLAIACGMQVTLLNRGKSTRPISPQAKILHADVRDPLSVQQALGSENFDVIVNWVAYTPAHVQQDVDLFLDRCGQYIFISSASAYKTPAKLPVTENWPLENPHWQYSRDKIACEKYLWHLHAEENFPLTVVRPSHTYDQTMIPLRGGWTTLKRIMDNKPVFIHGEGTSIWTLTHTLDFAKGFVGLLGNSAALGQAFHITGDEWLTWNEIYQIFADILQVKLQPHYFLSEDLAKLDAELGDGLLGDKMHSMIFNNSKIKACVPDFHAEILFRQGAQEIVNYYLADKSRQVENPNMLQLYAKLFSA